MIRQRCILLVSLVLTMTGCQSALRSRDQEPAAVPLTNLTDRGADGDVVPVIDLRGGDRVEVQATPPAVAPPTGRKPFNVLVLSGGGAYGAYSAGVLAGWTEAGTRPKFDVVTGVSTGALVATLAFLGAEKDADLKRFYTSLSDRDLYVRRSSLSALWGDALADSRPLERLIEREVTADLVAAVAAEHAKGRRLYIGTTHLSSRRLVVWDMGAIASRGGRGDVALFRRILLASASIPGFLPPVTIPVEVDGKVTDEMHVDGGVSASLFFRPPTVPRDQLADLGDRPLAGSNLYIIVAGKLFADPAPVQPRFLSIVQTSISGLLYAQTRGDLFQLYALSMATGMNYRVAAIPPDAAMPAAATTFDPAAMSRLYETGRRQAGTAGVWRETPPGNRPGEEVPVRGGARFSTSPGERN
ncbi:MAG TPA: patatin-like phospholipase family protein [Gemmataceae bacterium]|nr:patatin-like phospholipase family protein [Gemmataceae bacterium]